MSTDDKPKMGRPSREQTAALRPGLSRPKKPARPALSVPTVGAAGDRDAQGGGPFELGSVHASRYRILELLGTGGMGAVYRARDLTLGSDVALKVLDQDLAGDPARVEYFRNEMVLARRVTHGNVCRLYDIACDEGVWFITMEYIAGHSLADLLRGDQAIAFDEAERIFRDVAAGLAAAHKVGVVHRDLKPDNIMLEAKTGRALVADFGIAVELNQLGHAAVDRAGTRGYMSPEQAAGKAIDARTDVFALGVLGHRLLTGELPLVAPTRVAHTDVGGASPELPEVAPSHFRDAINRCLERDPNHRPRDASAVLALLDGTPVRRWRRTIATAVVSAALIASALGLAFFAKDWTGALTFAAPRVVVESVDATALDQGERWLADAFARRLVNELDDAWAIGGRTASDPGEEARRGDIALRIALRRDDAGRIAAQVDRSQGAAVSAANLSSDTFGGLAEAVAARLVSDGVPTELRRPYSIDLEHAGVRTALAWQEARRAQRASLRQEWPKVRVVAERGLASDPDCLACLIEFAWSFGGRDDARLEPMHRIIEIAAARPSLGTAWRRIASFIEANLAHDEPRMQAMVDALLADGENDRRMHAYLLYRWFAAQWFDDEREAMLPRLEWHVEKFPRISGVAKLVAEHFLDVDGEEERDQALRYAELALARGPDDLANRAQLARALMRFGRRDEALAQVAIIESADPEEKQHAYAGGERTNSLFDMYMALGDLGGAAQAARRLYNGPERQHGAASESLAFLAYMRGDEASGRRLHEEALVQFAAGAQSEFVASSLRKMVWIDYALGDYPRVIDVVERTPAETRRAEHPVIAELARYQLAPRREKRAALALAAAETEKLTNGPQKSLFALIIALERGEVATAMAQADVVRAGRASISGYYFLALAAEKAGENKRAADFYETLADHRFAWTEPIRAAAARLAAARLREQLGDRDRAREHYAAYVRQLDKAPPTHAGLELARERLAALR